MDTKTQQPSNGTPAQAPQHPAPQPNAALALATKQRGETQQLNRWLDEKRAWFASVLPKHMTPDRLIRIALFARSRNPDLLQCSPESLLRAIMECAEMGLEPTGASGGAWLVPFFNKKTGRKEATCIPDWRGYIKLALQSGKILGVEARVAYKNDTLFEIEEGLHPDIRHKPLTDGSDRGPMVAVYCVATLKGGLKIFEWMSKSQVDRIRNMSPGAKADAWTNHYEEQARKTVVRRAQKYWPKSKRLEVAAALDAALDDGAPGMVIDSTAMEAFLPDDIVAPPPPAELPADAATTTVAPLSVQAGLAPAQTAPPPGEASPASSPGAAEANPVAEAVPANSPRLPIEDAPADALDVEVATIRKLIAGAQTKKEATNACAARIMALPPDLKQQLSREYENRAKQLPAK